MATDSQPQQCQAIIERFQEQEESEKSEKSMSNFSQHIDNIINDNENDNNLKQIAQYYEQLQNKLLLENSELKQKNTQLQSVVQKQLKKNMHRRCSSDPNEAIIKPISNNQNSHQDGPQFEAISFIERQQDSTTQNDSFTMSLQQQLYGTDLPSHRSNGNKKVSQMSNLIQISEECRNNNQELINQQEDYQQVEYQYHVKKDVSCQPSAFQSVMQTPMNRSPRNSVICQQNVKVDMDQDDKQIHHPQEQTLETISETQQENNPQQQDPNQKKRDQCCIIF